MAARKLKRKTVWMVVSWVGWGDSWLTGGIVEALVAAGAGSRSGWVAGEVAT